MTIKILMQNNPEIEGDSNLPSIYEQHNPNSINRNTGAYSYFKALKDLKELDKRIWTLKNRVNLLSQKEAQANHPVWDFFEERQNKLKTLNREYREEYMMNIQKQKEKSISQINLKRTKNEAFKIENERRITRARKMITQQKFKRHDTIVETSFSNKKIIQRLKLQAMLDKQQRRNNIVQSEKKLKSNLKQLHDSRISTIRQGCKLQTNKIIEKIEKKERELKEIEAECQKNQQRLKNVLSKREKKMKRVQYFKKPNTTTIETASSILLDQEGDSSQRSQLSFVLIT